MTANPDLTIRIRDMREMKLNFTMRTSSLRERCPVPGRRSFSIEVVDVPVILVQQVVVDLFTLALGKFG